MFEIDCEKRWTHVRLNISPDGGVARLRVYGDVLPDWSIRPSGELVDLVAVQNGGKVVATSDIFLGPGQNLIMPGPAANMGDGWETKRRRGPGHDWAVIKLGRPGTLHKIEVDTKHFKGNHPNECSIEGCLETIGASVESLTSPLARWDVVLPKIKLQPDRNHVFEDELRDIGECSHIRLNIYPDGGVSRLRVWGVLRQ
jgi:allantoicase